MTKSFEQTVHEQPGQTVSDRRSGIVLVMVVIVIAIMALSSYGYTLMMQTENEATILAGHRIQARMLVDSGVEHVRLFLAQGEEYIEQYGGLYENPEWFQGVLVRTDEDQRNTGFFSVLCPSMTDEGVQSGSRFGLQDESVRLNLNILTLADAYAEKGGRTLLLALPGMTDEIADSILDWIDEDDEAREYGCEFNDYYKGLSPTYTPKNGPLDSVEELLLVRGVTPQLLFGADTNHNGVIDLEEQQQASEYEEDQVLGWANYLTLFSKEKNFTRAGLQRININGSNLQELYDDLASVMREEWASYIVAYRIYGPYTPADDDETDGIITGDDLDLEQEGSFTFVTALDLIDTFVQVDAGGETVIVESPINSTEPLGFALPVLADNLSVQDRPVITGRLNINQCSRQLMLGLPGMTEEIADEIISRRDLVLDDPDGADLNRNWETWLLAEQIVTLEEMKQMLPFITGSGHVYRGEIVGFFAQGKISSRASVVFDTTDRFPRILFWRDKSHLSLGYTREFLGAVVEE